MPRIEISIIVKEDRKKVYKLLKHMEEFPRFMKNVKDIKIIENLQNKIITKWNIDIDGANVIWEEEDIFNDNDMSIEFKMLTGDYKNYFGKWILTELTNNSTRIIISANFDWGIPVFEKFVGPVLERKARGALRGMLKAIKKELEHKKS